MKRLQINVSIWLNLYNLYDQVCRKQLLYLEWPVFVCNSAAQRSEVVTILKSGSPAIIVYVFFLFVFAMVLHSVNLSWIYTA